jgi:hypothetical protein
MLLMEAPMKTKAAKLKAKAASADVLSRGEADPLDVYRFPGHIEIVGDIMAPIYSDEELEEFFEASCKVFE